MQFYIQASTVEKSIKKEELRYARIDVTVGSIMAVAVAAFIIITCGATLYKAGVQRRHRPPKRPRPSRPWPASTPRRSSPLGLLVAGLFSAGILPLSTSYHVCEGMGWPAGVNHRVRRGQAVLRALRAHRRGGRGADPLPEDPAGQDHVLLPGRNGVLLPFVLLMMLRLVNDRDLMGDKVNSLLFNVIAYATVLLVITFTLAGVILPLVQGLFA